MAEDTLSTDIEEPLNNFLEWVRENVTYDHWYMGHLHKDLDLWRDQTIVWFAIRKMETNEVVDAGNRNRNEER